ncbi:hypothetical protein DFA_02007 [Cavenderia fasciculata]|uniref:Uncharacterized protein n=1 Tax=Cavenderia fasciculata TaxID=261658 RepID=F4PRC3_CACFS|nr:uncharacterized protein DFA_02007 [Cavenderia fasciculata]EGG22117.1 hypothetical protein DFA_02007 [Cavenderia fasciculata]|eukprot:XP_004359968.1 hypothetical protein DFA_02007 [Cavenderia fasciculata]
MNATISTSSSIVLFRRVIREGLRYRAFKQDSWWRNNVKELFRENKSVSDPKEIESLQSRVKSYRFYLKASKDIQNLLEEYNIGIPVRERLEKSSNRVGLKLPEWPEVREQQIRAREQQNNRSTLADQNNTDKPQQ